MDSQLQEQLNGYLSDAHSIEEQALAQLRTAPDIAGDPRLAEAFRQHLAETEMHEQLIRERMREHGESPSQIKDMLMAAGGKGFVLFARSQPDTPGKLAAHAYSYEALEFASYELLARVAERAGDMRTKQAAEQIRDQEGRMAERLEGLFDASVQASLDAHPTDDLKERLVSYLADAHAIEQQSIGLLERALEVSPAGDLHAAYEQHLQESRRHSQLVEQRLEALGGSPSGVKDAAMRLGALNWATFFKAHPDTPGKVAAFAYAFEHLEMGGYEQLIRVAERAGDAETARVARTILAEERAAAGTLAGCWDEAVSAALTAAEAQSART
jgi:ferritin-like metal-binding protein YciE